MNNKRMEIEHIGSITSLNKEHVPAIETGEYIKLSFHFLYDHPQKPRMLSYLKSEFILENTFSENVYPLQTKNILKHITDFIGDNVQNITEALRHIELELENFCFTGTEIEKTNRLIGTFEEKEFYQKAYSVTGYIYEKSTHKKMYR